MKKFALLSLIVFATACSSEQYETPEPAEVSEQVTVEEVTLEIYTDHDYLTPEQGEISGDISAYQGVDSSPYKIRIEGDRIYTFAYHEEGRVMTRLEFFGGIERYFDDNMHTLEVLNFAGDFGGLTCQGANFHNWDYDSEVYNGNMNVTPTGPNTWLVDYHLEGHDHVVNGFITIVRD